MLVVLFCRRSETAVLIKRFQALQEERVHTYKLFDEYVHFSCWCWYVDDDVNN